METWDRYDILMAVLATGAIACLATAFIAVVGHMFGALVQVIDNKREALYVRIVAGIIAAVLACFLAGTGLMAITLTVKVWTLP